MKYKLTVFWLSEKTKVVTEESYIFKTKEDAENIGSRILNAFGNKVQGYKVQCEDSLS